MIGNRTHVRGVWTNMHRSLAILTVLSLAACGADAAPSTAPSTVPAPSTLPAAVESVTDPVTDTSTASDASGSTAVAATNEGPQPLLQPLADMAAVSTDGRVTVARGGVFSEPVNGLVAPDGDTLLSTRVSADQSTTTITWTTLADGAVENETEVHGVLTAIATDPTAKVVALTAPVLGGTEIVITGRDGELFRRMYDTELLPEGFSDVYVDGSDMPIGLFVIEYLDPLPTTDGAPRRYRVRVLDTTSGQLGLPQNLRNKAELVDEEMLGFGRTHVLSPANGLLFTLYRGLDEDEAGYAFVHTLGFFNGVWCLDLPIDLDLGALSGSVVLGDNERKLYVVSANGYMAEFVVDDIVNLDTPGDPEPRRTESVWRAPGNTAGPALASSGAGLLVGQGGNLRWVDADSLTVTSTQTWDMSIEAVSLLPDGTAVAAGTRRVSAITPNGDLVGEATLPDDFGPVARIVVLDAK